MRALSVHALWLIPSIVLLTALTTGWLLESLQARADGEAPSEEGAIRLIVRADDIGSSHAANVACLRAYREGIARTVEVMVPCAWFPEAVKLLRDAPELDVGVHLTLTSEWEGCRWGPLTHAPSLVDSEGYLYPTTSQRNGFPPGTGFLEAKPVLAEVERELRAQIERAKARIPQVSHLTVHMGTATATPELRAVVEKLAREYDLPHRLEGVQPLRAFSGAAQPAEKIRKLVQALEDLGPGTWLLVDHPAQDTPEMRAIGHEGYRDVALDREGVTQAFTSREVLDVIERRKIRLVSYADVLGR